VRPDSEWQHRAAAWLIGWRVVEGVGAAMLFPAALAIVVAAFPPAGRGRALALFFAITGGLTAIGPIVGGYLVDWNWRSIFWVNIPIAIIALILTAIAKPTTERRDEPVDWTGALLTIVGMGLSVLGFQQAGTWGVEQSADLVLHHRRPDRSDRLRAVRVGTAVPTHQDEDLRRPGVPGGQRGAVLHVDGLRAGVLLPERLRPSRAGVQRARGWPLSDVVLHRVRHRIPDRRGDPGSQGAPNCRCWWAGVIGAIGYAGWAFNAGSLNAGAVTPWIAVGGFGVGLMLGPASTDAVNRAIDATYGEVTGITQTVRNYASALGFAILGSVMSNGIASDPGCECPGERAEPAAGRDPGVLSERTDQWRRGWHHGESARGARKPSWPPCLGTSLRRCRPSSTPWP
jgi:hypothetical protein